ncbi:MAG: flagellar export protein FliJ [Acetatifactor sp.]|nr:flagellar export protein FliJ [Acetatifactor sp.]
MARFRYSMQSILDIKLKLETQAKQDFSVAKAALDKEEELLWQLKERKRGYEARAVQLLSGTLDLQEIEENKAAILSMDGFIADQRERVALAEKRLEQARMRLTEVMQERKTHENLKEKAFDQFLVEENRREGKEVDELTSYVYGQRRSEENRERASV